MKLEYPPSASALGDLLDELHVTSPLIRTILTCLAVLTLVGGGLTFLYKFGEGAIARLRARQGEGSRRLWKRSAFAGFAESRVRDLDNKEEWSDQRFAELEAEVETIGASRRSRLPWRPRRGLRRERSLSRALIKSKEQLVLLQGDPGSGKSVALRYVARQMAAKARRSKRLDAVIPLYVNLKGLQAEGRPVDAQLIEGFVLDSFREGATADVDRFLEAEFENGKVDGTWFFLFDSFDEIPELLSSTDVDSAVRAYSDAISNFIHGVSKCRGVIASRHFRAPPSYGLPTFTIVPLSEKRRRKLIDKADLDLPDRETLDKVPSGGSELVALSENPLFLGLLVEYVRENHELPRGWYDVFEAFVSRRINTHQEKLRHSYGVAADELRLRSEEIAFTMTDTDGLGLSPRRSRLKAAYVEAGFKDVEQLDAAMDALQWTKLARTEEGNSSSTDPTFTFAHRRFQEYFATRVVLREPQRISTKGLLTDANWRETAVTLCQAQPETSEPMIEHAQQLLEDASASIQKMGKHDDFVWPSGVLHLLGLLQSAFAGHSDPLPASLRQTISGVLADATQRGNITDQKWALEVAGTAPSNDMASLLLTAFRGRSGWLREVAYRQAARLPSIPDDIAIEIRRTLVDLAAKGKVSREWRATRAQVMRLRPTGPFLSSARILRVAPLVDLVVCALSAVAGAMLVDRSGTILAFLPLAALFHATYYPLASIISRGLRGFLVGRVLSRGSILEIFGLLIRISAAEVRVATVPLVLFLVARTQNWSALLFFLAMAYAVTWTAFATAATIYRPPQSAAGWLLSPFRFLPGLLRGIRKIPLGAYLLTGGMLAVMGSVIWILSILPKGLATAFIFVLSGIGGLLIIFLVGRAIVSEFRSQFLKRRWSMHRKPRISSAEFLQALSDLREGGGILALIRDVRTERLLREDPEAEEVVGDLLRWARWNRARVTFDGDEMRPEPEWQSRAVADWAAHNGSILHTVAKADVEDLLGQLFEDLRREEEIPVA